MQTETAPLFLIGRSSRGHWVVRKQHGQCGGLFINRAAAVKFALFENGNHPEAVIAVPGVLELDVGRSLLPFAQAGQSVGAGMEGSQDPTSRRHPQPTMSHAA